MRAAGDVDHEVLAGLVARNAVHIDDEESMAVQIAFGGREQHGVVDTQLSGTDGCGKVGVEGGDVEVAVRDGRIYGVHRFAQDRDEVVARVETPDRVMGRAGRIRHQVEDERVGARAGVEGVRTAVTLKRVGTAAGADHVVAGAADQVVVSGTTIEHQRAGDGGTVDGHVVAHA